MFVTRFINGIKREKRAKVRNCGVVVEQVKKILQAEDQQLILMVRS